MPFTATAFLPADNSFPVHLLAKLLNVHRTHIVHLIETGELRCAVDLRSSQSSRSCIRVSRVAILEFLEAREIQVISPIESWNGKKKV